MKRALFFVVGCLALLPAASLAQFTLRTAPEPLVRQVRISPNNPTAGSTTLWTTSINGGMSKGIDNGTTITWSPMATSLPTTRLFSTFFIDDNTFYVMTDGSGVQKTTDGGTTFTARNGSGVTALGCLHVRNMTRFGADTFVGTACRHDSGMWKSSDDGATWSRIGAGTIPDDSVINAFTMASATFMLVSTTAHGIFRSIDGGANWAPANNGIPNSPLLATPNAFNIVCGANCSTLMFANIQGVGVYKSIDGGLTWADSSTGLPLNVTMASGMGRDAGTVPFTYYVITDGYGVFQSVDDGATWTSWGNTTTDPTVKYVRNVIRDGSVSNKYYVAKFDGVARTLDGGATWYSSPVGRGTYNSIMHDPDSPNVAYATNATVMRIPDIGAPAPVPLNNGLQGLTTDGVVYQLPTAPATMYTTTNSYGVFKSTDRGLNWAPSNTGLPTTLGQSPRLAIDRTDPQVIYLGSNGDPGIGIYKSTDGGATWTEANTGLPAGDARTIGRIFIDRVTPTTLYAATGAGLYKSTDGAGTWSVLYTALDGDGDPLPVSHVFTGFSSPNEIYIANYHVEPDGFQRPSSGILKSINGGTTWTNVLPKKAQQLRVLNGTVLIAGLADGPGQPAVMRSVDKGATWTNISAGLPGNDIRGFGTSADNGALVSATVENGFATLNSIQSLQFAVDDQNAAESGSAVVSVTRTGGTTGTATVQYNTFPIDAVAPGDFTPASGTLTFAAGVASATFSVPITADSVSEGLEQLGLRLFNPTNPTGTVMLGARYRSTITIVDNDSTFEFSTPTASVNESGPNVTLTVTRTGSMFTAASVNWATSNGTAMAGQDFGTNGSAVQRTGTLSWAAGDSAPKTIAIGPVSTTGAYIPIINDALIEGPETFTVTLTSASGAALGGQKTATVTIISDERGVAMGAPTANAFEAAGTISIPVVRTGPPTGGITVNYAFTNGTAINGTHYTGVPGQVVWIDGDSDPRVIVVPIADNSVVNAARTFTVTLSGAVGATLATPTSTTATIKDDDSTLQFSAATATASEGAALVLTVTRLGFAGEAASASWSTADGTALAGTDFGTPTVAAPVTGTVSWAPGDAASKTVTIPMINDSIVESIKTFTVSLASPTGANLGAIPTVNVTLNDNDSGVTIAQPTYSILENVPTLTITVNRIGPATSAASVTWTTANGTAISGQHFGVKNNAANRTGVLSWPAGNAAAKTISIPILNNDIADGTRTFTVALSAPSAGLIIGSPGTTTVSITDDDIPPQSQVVFDSPKVMVLENAGSVTLMVNRVDVGGGFGLPASVAYATAPGTALAGSDYTTKTGTLNWAGGDASPKAIVINITNDNTPESPEQFKVNLSGATPGTSIGLASATVLILDDDEVFPPDGAIPADWEVPVGATAGWHVVNEPGAYDGVFSLRADDIGDNETAQIEVTRTFIAGNVVFYPKVSTEAGFDVLRFYVDGVEKGAWSGTAITGWQVYNQPITPGVHTLRWSYEKDGSASVGADAVWIDGVRLP